jgi:tagaturonate reductase
MKPLNRSNTSHKTLSPIKVVQFGEGNFLRAFADWMIDLLNERNSFDAGVAIVQPIARGMIEVLKKQQGLYHLMMRGISKGEIKEETRLISCVNSFINPYDDFTGFLALARGEDLQLVFSNTTEAGIEFLSDDIPGEGALAQSFPGKFTQFLYHRYLHFDGNPDAGLGIIPCELIDRNGEKLREAIMQYVTLWNLPESFGEWIGSSNYFANTLVDRIVTGYPQDEIDQIQQQLGFEDQLVVTSEVFHLWVIEGPQQLQQMFPAHLHGLNVKYVPDQTPYRTRKVRILNGAHTSMVAVGMLANIATVKEATEDRLIGTLINDLIFKEVIPTIDLPEEELIQFALEVMERFKNPFIRHELSAIALNSISKFKVRVLPSILDFIDMYQLAPKRLCLAFAALIKLYVDGAQGKYPINDNPEIVAWFSKYQSEMPSSDLIPEVCGNSEFWGQSLVQNQILLNQVVESYGILQQSSIRIGIQNILSE